MSVALVGRIVGVACAVLAVATACGGHSVSSAGDGADDGWNDDGSSDDGSSDDESGGSGGTGGAIAVGGTTPAGGTSYGGTGQGGIAIGGYGGAAPMGGVAGSVSVGGAGPCGDCPDWEYGLAVDGDGSAFAMDYVGYIPNSSGEAEMVACAETPVRGSIGGCGYFDLHACAGPMSEPPCFEVTSGNARYLDRAGRIWSGVVTVLSTSPSIPGASAGYLRAELSAEGNALLVLDVDYSFCGGSVLRVICR